MSTAIFWDVQHGHATTVISPSGRVFVVDLGQGSYGFSGTFRPLVSLYNSGIRTIDHLIISHPHLDHIDDIQKLGYLGVRAMTRPMHLTFTDVMHGVREVDQPKFE